MGLIFIDGFDHYATAQIDEKYENTSGSPAIGAGGRWGNNNLDLYWTYMVEKRFPKKKSSTIYVGFGFKSAVTLHAPDASNPLFRFKDEDGTTQVSIYGDASDYLRAYQGATLTTLYGTADTVYPINQWVYIEVKIVVDNSAGIVQIKMNEQTILNATGLDTKVGTDYIGRVQLWGGYYQKNIDYDDFYIDDSQFHGNCRVRTFLPDSDSPTHTDFVRSGGSNDYECVDENPPNDDTDYISADALGAKSAFGITTGALSETVKGLQLNNRLKASASGIRRMKSLCRSGGADYKSPVTGVIPVAYGQKEHIWNNDPDDSQPWNQTKLEAGEFGLELVAGTTTTTTTTSTTSTTTS